MDLRTGCMQLMSLVAVQSWSHAFFLARAKHIPADAVNGPPLPHAYEEAANQVDRLALLF